MNFYLPSVSDFSLVATFNDIFDARLTGKISDEMQKVNYTAKFEVLTHSIFATVGYDVTTEHKKIDFTINPYVQIIGEIKGTVHVLNLLANRVSQQGSHQGFSTGFLNMTSQKDFSIVFFYRNS